MTQEGNVGAAKLMACEVALAAAVELDEGRADGACCCLIARVHMLRSAALPRVVERRQARGRNQEVPR